MSPSPLQLTRRRFLLAAWTAVVLTALPQRSEAAVNAYYGHGYAGGYR